MATIEGWPLLNGLNSGLCSYKLVIIQELALVLEVTIEWFQCICYVDTTILIFVYILRDNLLCRTLYSWMLSMSERIICCVGHHHPGYYLYLRGSSAV